MAAAAAAVTLLQCPLLACGKPCCRPSANNHDVNRYELTHQLALALQQAGHLLRGQVASGQVAAADTRQASSVWGLQQGTAVLSTARALQQVDHAPILGLVGRLACGRTPMLLLGVAIGPGSPRVALLRHEFGTSQAAHRVPIGLIICLRLLKRMTRCLTCTESHNTERTGAGRAALPSLLLHALSGECECFDIVS